MMINKDAKNILIRGVNWIGDSIMTLPTIKSLRKIFKNSNISLLIKPWVFSIFENNPDINEIIKYEDEYNTLLGHIKLANILKKRKFDIAILLQNAFDAALITFLAGIKERAGYKRDGRGFLLTKPINIHEKLKNKHQVYYYLNLIEGLGFKPEFSIPYIYLKIDERINARNYLSHLKRPTLGINPGATYGSAKRWFPERFAEIASWFIKDTDGSVIIFGSKSETDISEEIIKHIETKYLKDYVPIIDNKHSKVLDLTGRTTLRELVSLISECDVFLTNDSGPLHISYAVGTPLVALFGSTNPELTGPLGNSNIVIKSDTPCSPCFNRSCKQNDLMCMHTITSDEVYYGIKKLLYENRAVFFDRDGTLCKDNNYINNFDKLEIFPEINQLSILKEHGFKIIGISNQSGISRGLVDENFVKEVNKIFIKKYNFDAFYYCPHHPDEHCSCRKPELGMLIKAKGEFNINIKKSYIIGDKETDMLLAKASGAKGILVKTGEAKTSIYADFIAEGLKEAIGYIIKESINGA